MAFLKKGLDWVIFPRSKSHFTTTLLYFLCIIISGSTTLNKTAVRLWYKITFSLSESNSSSSIEITDIAVLMGCRVSITPPGKRLPPSIFGSSDTLVIASFSGVVTTFTGSSSLLSKLVREWRLNSSDLLRAWFTLTISLVSEWTTGGDRGIGGLIVGLTGIVDGRSNTGCLS